MSQPAPDAAPRFHAFAQLESKLSEAKNAPDERRLIDPAKAILMRNKTLDESAAYALLRRLAMNHNKRIVDIARAIVAAEDLERFPITWNHVIDKELLNINKLEQVLVEKVCQLFRNLL